MRTKVTYGTHREHRGCNIGAKASKNVTQWFLLLIQPLKVCHSHHMLSTAWPVPYSTPRSPTSAMARIASTVGPGHLSRTYAATMSCPLEMPPTIQTSAPCLLSESCDHEKPRVEPTTAPNFAIPNPPPIHPLRCWEIFFQISQQASRSRRLPALEHPCPPHRYAPRTDRHQCRPALFKVPSDEGLRLLARLLSWVRPGDQQDLELSWRNFRIVQSSIDS